MSTTPQLPVEFLNALGPMVCITEATDRAAFEQDFRKLYHGKALAVLKPQTVEQVQTILSLAKKFQLSVVPVGGNTSYCGGATPDSSGQQLVLSLSRLNRIRQVNATGFTITVEAGCTLEQVQRVAEQAGRRLPLTLGSQGSCQIGGNLSTNAGGTSVLRFGMMRDLVLGLEVVLADGSICNQLKGLHKDNTGYDIKHWFIGAEGTLGIITAVTLKLYPQPQDFCTAMVALSDIGAAVRLLEKIREHFGDCIESFEFLPESACALARKNLNLRDPFEQQPPSARVLIELAVPKAWDGLSNRLNEFLIQQIESNQIHDVAIANSSSERLQFWELRERIPEAQTIEGASIKHDVSLPLTALQEFVDQAHVLVHSQIPGARIINYGHVGDGNLHYNISPPMGVAKGSYAENNFLEIQPTITRQIHDLVDRLGGSFSAEHGIGKLKTDELERYEDPTALKLMRVIKTAIDPDNLLNPGKVLRFP